MILEDTATKILAKLLKKVPSMQGEFTDYVVRVIQNARDKSRETTKEVIDSELNYIFTND